VRRHFSLKSFYTASRLVRRRAHFVEGEVLSEKREDVEVLRQPACDAVLPQRALASEPAALEQLYGSSVGGHDEGVDAVQTQV